MNGVPGYAGAIVNPALVLAIESTRQALGSVLTGIWPELPALKNWRPDPPQALDEPEMLLRWQPESRMSVLEFEAIAGLSFEIEADTVKLMWRGQTQDSKDALPLATMSRPNKDVLQKQADIVARAAGARLQPKSDQIESRDRLTEITAQVVPPFAFWCAVLPIHPDRMPRTIELMQLMLSLCGVAEQRFKHALAVPRPQYFNPSVFPAILTPSHASLPSGHATEAFAVSNLLYQLMTDSPGVTKSPAAPELRALLLGLAMRIANNRFYAGLHTPIDTSAGRMLGTVLANYLVARCTQGSPTLGVFPGSTLPNELGVLNGTNGKAVDGNKANCSGLELVELGGDGICTLKDSDSFMPENKALGWLWHRARAEFGSGWTMPLPHTPEQQKGPTTAPSEVSSLPKKSKSSK